MKREWVAREAPIEGLTQIKSAYGVSDYLAAVMVGRNINSLSDAAKYLDPQFSDLSNPFLLQDMGKACDRLAHAIVHGEKIGIFGDYDVDGVCSSALLSDFLEQTGAEVCAKIPNRLVDGYGMNLRLLEEMKSEGVKVVVTVDCGITNHEEIEQAYHMGMEVIVVDHHTVPVTLPKAHALINPHQPECAMGAHYLCAGGVVFFLCMALRKHLREKSYFSMRKEPNLRDLLDLVALATVADVMQLKEANRIFVKNGLDVLKEGKRLGLRSLSQIAGVQMETLQASTLGFQIGPRINAAGRLDDASIALRLLQARNYDQAEPLARLLDMQNVERKQEEKRITAEAILQIEKNVSQDVFVNVVYDSGWHPGVVGIVASRLVEKFGKPAIVIGAEGKGSGRSIPAFHLHDAVASQRSLLSGFGGHAHAIGLHLDISGLNRFREQLNAYAQNILKPEDFVQTYFYDGVCSVGEVSMDLAKELDRAAPFGRGNPEPLFLFESLSFRDLRELKGGHVRGKISGRPGLDFVGFGLSDRVSDLNGRPANVLATIEVNKWRSSETLQLRIRDLQETGHLEL